MCIRDSSYALQDAKGKDIRPAVFIDELGLLASERVLPPGCLLYTSDAADERSSVDLGGRRIIKKKKNHDIAGWTLA